MTNFFFVFLDGLYCSDKIPLNSPSVFFKLGYATYLQIVNWYNEAVITILSVV